MKILLLKKMVLLALVTYSVHSLFIFAKNYSPDKISVVSAAPNDGEEENSKPLKKEKSLYQSLNLAQLNLGEEAFDKAVCGYNNLSAAGKVTNQFLSIVDFSQPSAKKRLYVIDMKNAKLLFNTYVSHGRNSGKAMAREFSNDAESNKSSLGFFVTGDSYIGKHGFSLRLLGQEKGINDNACDRAIVMHSAAYVSEAAIQMQGFAGRSLGCPALPEELHKPIIEKIKSGSCLFLYSPDAHYASHSTFLKKNV